MKRNSFGGYEARYENIPITFNSKPPVYPGNAKRRWTEFSDPYYTSNNDMIKSPRQSGDMSPNGNISSPSANQNYANTNHQPYNIYNASPQSFNVASALSILSRTALYGNNSEDSSQFEVNEADSDKDQTSDEELSETSPRTDDRYSVDTYQITQPPFDQKDSKRDMDWIKPVVPAFNNATAART